MRRYRKTKQSKDQFSRFLGRISRYFLVFLVIALFLTTPVAAKEYILDHEDEAGDLGEIRRDRDQRVYYERYSDNEELIGMREELELLGVGIRNNRREIQELDDDWRYDYLPERCRNLVKNRFFRSYANWRYDEFGWEPDIEDWYLYDRDCWEYFGKYGLPYASSPYAWWSGSFVWDNNWHRPRFYDHQYYRNHWVDYLNWQWWPGHPYHELDDEDREDWDEWHRGRRGAWDPFHWDNHGYNRYYGDYYRNCVYYSDPILYNRCMALNYPPRRSGSYEENYGEIGDPIRNHEMYRSWKRSCSRQAGRNQGVLSDWCARTREYWDEDYVAPPPRDLPIIPIDIPIPDDFPMPGG